MVLHVLLCRQGSRLGRSCRGLDDAPREVGTTFREWAHARKKQRHNCCKRWLERTRPDRHRKRDESGKKPQSPFWSMPIAVWGSWGEGRHHGLRLPSPLDANARQLPFASTGTAMFPRPTSLPTVKKLASPAMCGTLHSLILCP